MLGRTQNGLNDLSSLSKKDLIKRAEKFSKRYCVGDGKNFKMSDYSTSPELTLPQPISLLQKNYSEMESKKFGTSRSFACIRSLVFVFDFQGNGRHGQILSSQTCNV
jgi:hypothetical protein